jgi:hypothetical protein
VAMNCPGKGSGEVNFPGERAGSEMPGRREWGSQMFRRGE